MVTIHQVPRQHTSLVVTGVHHFSHGHTPGTHLQTHAHLQTYAHTCTHMHTQNMHTCTCVHMGTHICVHMHTHTHTHTCTLTHGHTSKIHGWHPLPSCILMLHEPPPMYAITVAPSPLAHLTSPPSPTCMGIPPLLEHSSREWPRLTSGPSAMDSPFKNVQIDVRKRQKSCTDGKDMGVRSLTSLAGWRTLGVRLA